MVVEWVCCSGGVCGGECGVGGRMCMYVCACMCLCSFGYVCVQYI